jgi:hypothetical protein
MTCSCTTQLNAFLTLSLSAAAFCSPALTPPVFDNVLVFFLGQDVRNLPLIPASSRTRMLIAVCNVSIGYAPNVYGDHKSRECQPEAKDRED